MDVERLQRINTLAGELRKRNFALSSDEAYRQAEQVYEAASGDQVVVHEVPQGSVHAMQQPEDLSSRRVELLIEMHGKKYEQEFTLFRNAINTLAAELEAVRGEIHKIHEQDVTPQAKQKEKQAELKPEAKEPHPRQGNFTPNDVDIRKMFYFCAKR